MGLPLGLENDKGLIEIRQFLCYYNINQQK
uniref:Uncharacterized protein n=1 Tax=Globisporangium ultimum (strain ATCC 200006 / CBS 805.95 / DAOM BR144) TaxID=431595 RepID=K3XD00_GLOUD